MKGLTTFTVGLLIIGMVAVWNSQQASGQGPWVTLLDGKNMGDWNPVGDAVWRLEDGAWVSDKGRGNLVSKKSYKDFQVKAELWVAPESNTGVYIRIQTPDRPSSKAGYEVNINDQSKNEGYGTGAIVGVAKVPDGKYAAGNRWNVFDITARGAHIVVVLNGVTTLDIKHDAWPSGPIGLQAGGGIVKFRKVEIREF